MLIRWTSKAPKNHNRVHSGGFISLRKKFLLKLLNILLITLLTARSVASRAKI